VLTRASQTSRSGVSAVFDKEPPSGPHLLADYIGKEQLAQAFGVSARTVERWVRLRQFPAPLKLGRKRLYYVPTVRKYLADLNGFPGRAAR